MEAENVDQAADAVKGHVVDAYLAPEDVWDADVEYP